MATKLGSFFVYNSLYGPKEGEEIKKVLYYYPPTADENTKCRDVGLSEAMIKFVETFSDNPCKSIHTQKQRHLYLEAEPGFWMIMKLNVPHSKKLKTELAHEEYHDENMHDDVYEKVLKQAYDMFRLFMGSFADILSRHNDDVEQLKQRLEHFFGIYLTNLKLTQCDILDVYGGVSWLPLDKPMYLRIQCLMNRLESKYSEIEHTAFLCMDYLVWSGVTQQDIRIIYQYLITSLFPDHHEKEMTPSGATSSNSKDSQFGQFITDTPKQGETTPAKLPRVYLSGLNVDKECQLLVYRALSLTVCAFIKGSITVTPEFCKTFAQDLGPTLTELASDLKGPQRPFSIDNPIKYVYFNQMNSATKTTVHVDTRKSRHLSIPVQVLSTICDIHADLKKSHNDSECIVRTMGEHWVTCKKSDTRELFVVVTDRNANLTQVHDEVRRLCSTHFPNMFDVS